MAPSDVDVDVRLDVDDDDPPLALLQLATPSATFVIDVLAIVRAPGDHEPVRIELEIGSALTTAVLARAA